LVFTWETHFSITNGNTRDLFPLLKQSCSAPPETFLEISDIHRGKEKLPEAAKMQHLKWHQAPMFKLLYQSQHASTEVSFPRRGFLRRGKDQRVTMQIVWNCAVSSTLRKRTDFLVFLT